MVIFVEHEIQHQCKVANGKIPLHRVRTIRIS